MSGFLSPTSGSVIFTGEDITGRRSHHIVARGLVRTFQLTTLFQDMSVLENVLLGLHLHSRMGLGQVLFSRRAFPSDELARAARCWSSLVWRLMPTNSQGTCRTVTSASSASRWPWRRARLLLLDEPVTGMNMDESARVMGLVKTIRDRGTTILLVEHNMKAVMGTCERIVVLNFGQKLAEGPPAAVSTNPEVIRAYLGAGADACLRFTTCGFITVPWKR